jgi:cell division septation protein DedD
MAKKSDNKPEEKVVKQDLIAIEGNVTPAVIDIDFDKIRVELEGKLEKYDIVVTVDTVKGAKELSTELNKTATAMDTRRKELINEASLPIKEADQSMKDLVAMCKTGRTKILTQVETFENETKAKLRVLLDEERTAQYEAWKVSPEFQQVDISDMAKLLGNITSTGKLSSKAKNEIGQRVIARHHAEQTVEKRLLELDGKCLNAGLKSALVRANINHLLQEEDEYYYKELGILIDAELERQVIAENRAATVAEKVDSLQPTDEKPAPASQDEEVVASTEALPENKPATRTTSSTKQDWVVSVGFRIQTGKDAGTDMIRSKLKERLLKAGFNEDIITGITIVPAQ